MGNNNKIPTKTTQKKIEKSVDLSNFNDLFDLVKNTSDVNSLTPLIIGHINRLISESGLSNYEVMFLHDDDSITEYTQNKLYDSFSGITEPKNLLLIIDSSGGSIEPAYFISKSAKKIFKKFVVAVPRKAKSAATLISLGADEIHMGIVSQLGPIDPQINGLPALAISNAIENIARMSERHPASSDMFAKYLALTVKPATFGYFERITESASQYAQRLLEGKKLPKQADGVHVWDKLVYEYKDHSFVIDYDEASKLLGKDFIKSETAELKLAESIYKFIDDISLMIRIFKKYKISIIGKCESGILLNEVRNDK